MFLAWRLRRRAPLIALGIAFFFAAHLMESTIFPLEIMFEHRNYLASYGVFLCGQRGPATSDQGQAFTGHYWRF